MLSATWNAPSVAFGGEDQLFEGKTVDHVHVRRGRILNQLNGKELIERVRGLLAARAGGWPLGGNAG